jgi:hypothetical protein
MRLSFLLDTMFHDNLFLLFLFFCMHLERERVDLAF